MSATEQKQPRKLYALFLTEMWERYGFYTINAALVLYMTKVLLLNDAPSYAIFGAFSALLYLTPTIGGYLADRLLGFRYSIFIGGVFLTLGYALLAIPHFTYFYLGLSAIIIGNGFFKPCVSSIVGELYGTNDPRREGGFSIFYAGINLGGLFPPLIIAAVVAFIGWWAVFIMAAIGVLLGMFIFGITIKPKDNLGKPPECVQGKNLLPAYALLALGIGMAFIVCYALMIRTNLANTLLFIGGGIFVAYALTKSFRFEPQARNRLLLCHLLIFFSIVFWVLYQQSASALTIYTEYNTNRALFGFYSPFSLYYSSWHIPTVAFQSVNPIVIIVFAPILSWLWTRLDKYDLNPSIPAKFALGTIFMGAGFVLIPFAMHFFLQANSQISQWWIDASYLLQSIGELMLSPVGLSMVTELSPVAMIGLMMGAWFFASAVANALAGIVAQWTTVPSNSNDPHVTYHAYYTVFNGMGWTSVIIGFVMLALTPMLKRMLGQRLPTKVTAQGELTGRPTDRPPLVMAEQ